MFKKNKFTILLLIFSLMIIERVSKVYSQADTSSGIGSILEGQTWYICSKGATNFIDYSMRMVETSQDPTPGFGTNVIGNRPKQFNTVGLLTIVANYTNIRALVDPSRPSVLYREELSCNVEPVQECSKSTNPPLSIQDILCLAIMNPNSNTTKFTASISFDQNASKPILIIPPPIEDSPNNTNNPPPSSPTKSTPHIDPTETHSFFVNIANRSKIIDPGYLLLLGSFISIILT